MQCYSQANGIIRELHNPQPSGTPDLTRVDIRWMPPQFPSQRLSEQNAVIFADTDETLNLALSRIPAVPTAPQPENPQDGWGVHILPSEVMVTTTDNGYGRMDFWDREPLPNDQIPPPLEDGPEAKEPAPGPMELAETAVQKLEELAETAAIWPSSTPLKELETATRAALDLSDALHS